MCRLHTIFSLSDAEIILKQDYETKFFLPFCSFLHRVSDDISADIASYIAACYCSSLIFLVSKSRNTFMPLYVFLRVAFPFLHHPHPRVPLFSPGEKMKGGYETVKAVIV